VTDRQTDRRTDRILLAIPRLHYMQRGKKLEQLQKYVGSATSVKKFATGLKHVYSKSVTDLRQFICHRLETVANLVADLVSDKIDLFKQVLSKIDLMEFRHYEIHMTSRVRLFMNLCKLAFFISTLNSCSETNDMIAVVFVVLRIVTNECKEIKLIKFESLMYRLWCAERNSQTSDVNALRWLIRHDASCSRSSR